MKAGKSVTDKRDTSSRARTPFLQKGCLVVTGDNNRDVTTPKRDSDITALPPRHHHGNSSERTDVAKSVLVIAQRVLENVTLGRVYPQGTVEWAEAIVRGNAPPPPSRSEAQRHAPAHDRAPA